MKLAQDAGQAAGLETAAHFALLRPFLNFLEEYHSDHNFGNVAVPVCSNIRQRATGCSWL
jgi:hypothetical protein